MAENQITSILDAHIALKDENTALRSRLQRADAEARKVPALGAEVDRLRSDLEGARKIVAGQKDVIEEGRAELAKHESISRDIGALEEELHDANEAAERADAAREDAEEALSNCKRNSQGLVKVIDEHVKEIARLKEVEEKALALGTALKGLIS